MPAGRDTRIEASRLRRLSPLQTLEDQSQTWGIRCHSCTWREGLAPSWKLRCKIHDLAVCPEASASFRPTDRTLQSMDRSLHPPLLQNPACDFHRTRLLSDAPLVMGIRRARPSARQTCDLRDR